MIRLILLSQVLALTLWGKVVVGHRGASGYLPEHTLASAAVAFAQGADYVEPDVVLSKDNVPVLLHDTHVDTTTDVATKFPHRQRPDGRWYAIDFTLAELKTLNVTERKGQSGKAVFPKRFPTDTVTFRIPTLQEFVELVQGMNKSMKKNIGIYPEIKMPKFHEDEGKDITKIVYQLLKKYGYEDNPGQIYLQCFDPRPLKRLKWEFKTKMPLIQLLGGNRWEDAAGIDHDALRTSEGLAQVAKYAQGVGVWIGHTVDQNSKPNRLVSWAKQNGLQVHAYTIREDLLPDFAPTVDQLLDFVFVKLGVDGVFTDFTPVVKEYLHKSS